MIGASLLLASFVFINRADAQIKVSVNFNIGSQPTWGPTGYDYAQYYYMPDIDSYYDVSRRQFIYSSGNRWVRSSKLPSKYRNYNLDNGYKVVVNQQNPYLQNNSYRDKYAQYKNNHSQQIIRNSNESKYFVVKGHPKYNQRNKNHNNH